MVVYLMNFVLEDYELSTEIAESRKERFPSTFFATLLRSSVCPADYRSVVEKVGEDRWSGIVHCDKYGLFV